MVQVSIFEIGWGKDLTEIKATKNGAGLDFANTVANAPKIVRMRLVAFCDFFLGLPLLVENNLYPF